MFDLQRNPDRSTLRRFGFITTVVFGVLAACAFREVLWFGGGLGRARVAVSATLLAIGVASGVSSIVQPRANRALYLTLSTLAYPIGFVLSYCVLGLLFFGIVTPLGLLLRCSGRDPLARALRRDASSYWVAAHGPRPRSRYFRQF